MHYDVYAWWRRFALAFSFIVLIVLLFFMCVLPFIPAYPPFMNFPEAASARRAPDSYRDLTISIVRDGRICHELTVLTPASLAALLAQRDPGAELFLRVDRDAPFSSVRAVTVAAREAGIARMTIMVWHRDDALESASAWNITPHSSSPVREVSTPAWAATSRKNIRRRAKSSTTSTPRSASRSRNSASKVPKIS